ncbi:serine hydrolase [Gilvibacter sediminis]|uniref:serine hydrolase n=1 Tax=Gilvibacter sediminis TaxID=379071 RepID=UPI0023507A75|nr:serine hydrolase [Gilvibacter sediminis]MDC7998822.1 serine hydrolase [Gilvibacter sediminis]
MKNPKRIFQMALLCFVIVASGSLSLHAQDLQSNVDNMLAAQYPADAPGISALIAKDGKVIYKNAFGLANMELSVPMNPENVFELGSITKQFTAVAILMLQEAGKLNVEDPITKFFPDYPTDGNDIKIHHLLNHTSGIKSYTGMQSFQYNARKDMTPTEIIDFFKNEPMDFKTGEQWLYNNSGYIILGAIIEQVSGMSYEAFIQENIFDPLGMKHSYYGSKTKLIPNRAWGYQPTDSGWRNADYLSMSLPYAAGSLMSNVEDMLIWQEALNDGKLLPNEKLAAAFVNTTLNNGDPTYYGYGWQVNEVNESPSVEHGGGIFGYNTYGLYLPEEDVYVIALCNSNGNSPTDVAIKMAAMAIGKPYPDNSQGVSLSQQELQKWVGAYLFDGDVVRFVTLENGQLFSQREGSSKLPLIPASAYEFYFEGSTTKYTFSMGDQGKQVLFEDRINKEVGLETVKEVPTAPEEIDMPAAVLANYEGTYELQPGFEIRVFLEAEKLMVQATGQSAARIYPSAPHEFFLKVVPGALTFNVDADGKATGLVLKQGGQVLPAKKID